MVIAGDNHDFGRTVITRGVLSGVLRFTTGDGIVGLPDCLQCGISVVTSSLALRPWLHNSLFTWRVHDLQLAWISTSGPCTLTSFQWLQLFEQDQCYP